MPDTQASFSVVPDETEENKDHILSFVPAKYDIEAGSPIPDFDWGQKFVGNDGK